jgi:AraC family transcriptional regulator
MSISYRTLYASPVVTVRDVVCSAGCGNGRHEEHCQAATLAFVRSGAFVRRDRMGRHVADATRVVFFDPAEPYMVDHPLPGGDRCTSLIFDQATLREAVRHRRGEPERLFARASLAGTAGMHVAHRRLLEAAHSADAVEVEETALRLLQICTRDDDEESLRGAAARRAAALAADAQVLIAELFTERVSLEMLAEKLDVSTFRLCRAFRLATGGSLHQHLTRLRLAAALDKLPQYRDQLTALAFDLGFSSHSHFSYAFRTYFGRAPSAFLWRPSISTGTDP